ncbi:MAG: response regulator [Hyphomicrobiaceae bacterium]|nr:response regulator [Hyphomicrobiaceae bacterium]
MSKGQPSRSSTDLDDPLALVSTGGNTLVVVLVMLAFGAAVLAVLSAQATEPLVLTVMAVLSMFGAFFLFGVAAGHIRVSERSPESEIVKALSDRIDDGVVVCGSAGHVVYANEPSTVHLGRNELGALNSFDEALAGTPAGSEALFRLTGAAKRGEFATEEVALDSGAGEADARWLRVSVKPFGHLDVAEFAGRAVIWTFTDITREKRQAVRARRHVESRLERFEAMPAGVLSTDPAGRIVFVSSVLANWLGLEGEDADRPVQLSEIVAGDGAELVRSVVRERGRAGAAPRVDLDLVRRDGRRWPATLVVQGATADRPDAGFDAVVLARADAGVATAEGSSLVGSQFASLFQSAPFGIATLSDEGVVMSANAAFSRLILDGRSIGELPAEELLTRHLADDKKPEILEALNAAYAGQANIPPVEIEVGANGEFTRRVFFNALAGPSSERGPVILYVTDATEEKALGAKFAQSQKMEAVGKLAGGIAHDFNNVLTAIIGFSDLLLTSHRPGDHAYKNIQNIRSSANHAAGLVKQLLAFSRRQTLTTETLQLNEVVTDLSVILNRLLGENVELKISSGRELWAVKADRNQLNQVVINLAVNARDAMPDGGRLTIRTRNVPERESQRRVSQGMPVGQYVVVEVEDTGIGMSPEVMKKIFEPFFTTKDIGKGTGLGLSTVYGIIKQTGGYVFADSTVGEGTTFQVYLPRYVASEDEIAPPAVERKPERKRDLTGNGRVLIVEDEDAVRMFAVEALRRQGYDVVEACDGIDALEIMEEHEFKFDLVVSDVKMPEMDGPTLYNETRARGSDVKFVFVSGYADDAFATQLSPGDDYAFMPKPYTLAQIAEKVKEQLG